jgi:hypothetical protein
MKLPTGVMVCPAHRNAGHYATLIAEGRFEGAYRFARDPNPLTSICRRVCGATWYLGAMTFGTFMILVITGVLLMLYYHPSVPQAYPDMKDLQYVVSSIVFLHNLHRWSVHAMVFLMFAHMFKVFYRGPYRTPREVIDPGVHPLTGCLVADVSEQRRARHRAGLKYRPAA